MRRIINIAVTFSLILWIGCGTTPPSYFYTLSATPAPAGTSSDLSVVVGPVTVPAIVDRPQIVINTGANQVRFEEFNRWASPLQNNISRVVADNLMTLLGTTRVTLFTQTLNEEVNYRIAIEVQSFQSMPGELAALDAVWTVRRTKDGKASTLRTNVREAVQENSYAALAAAHSRALASLSRDIADAVRALDRSGQ